MRPKPILSSRAICEISCFFLRAARDISITKEQEIVNVMYITFCLAIVSTLANHCYENRITEVIRMRNGTRAFARHTEPTDGLLRHEVH